MVFSISLFSSSCDLEVQRYKMKWTKKGEFLELDKYLIRLVLRFFAAISGKEHRLKCITKAKEISEGNERGFKERKIEREERRGTEKEMLENGFFANLGAIKSWVIDIQALFWEIFKLKENIIYFVLTMGGFLIYCWNDSMGLGLGLDHGFFF